MDKQKNKRGKPSPQRPHTQNPPPRKQGAQAPLPGGLAGVMANEPPALSPDENRIRRTPEIPDDLLFGINPVREALRKGRPIARVWLFRDRDDRIAAEIVGLCQKANIPYSKAEKAFMDNLCQGAPHQGVAAKAAPKAYTPWREMLAKAAERGQVPLIVLLDEVEDPQNLGAVIRSADALGAHGVVIPKHRAAPMTSGAGRASAGALEYVMVDRVTNLARTLEEMKAEGLWVFGATSEAALPVYEADWSVAAALVLGGENKGLSPLIRKKCDIIINIPLSGQINSLNVSAAAAAILSEISRQRKFAVHNEPSAQATGL